MPSIKHHIPRPRITSIAVALVTFLLPPVALGQTKTDTHRSAKGAPIAFAAGTSIVIPPLNTDAAISAKFLLGLKVSRIVIGVGSTFTISNSGDGFVGDGQGSNSQSRSTKFVISPELQVTAYRWDRLQLELFGLVSTGLGRMTHASVGSYRNMFPDDMTHTYTRRYSAMLFSWRAGFGARHWFHPQLAMHTLFGAAGVTSFDAESERTLDGQATTASDPSDTASQSQESFTIEIGLLATF